MPGITGIIGPGKYSDNVNTIQQMVQSMLHEPFYASGTRADKQAGFWIGWAVHKHSFSDCMPIWNEKKDICFFFYGEDFMSPQDIIRLRSRGHDFEEGNVSYIVHLYEEMGTQFIEKLSGWFAGALIDSREKKIILFNDRYGLGRIYYHQDDEAFFFSSEAKSLLRIVPELRKIDPQSFGESLSCGCVLQNRTLFQGISLIPGGSIWTFSGGDIDKSFYFLPEAWSNQEPLGNEEYYEKLKETWIRCLPQYLRGKGPVAVSLTGGKDSRLIMAWTDRISGSLPCYTFGGPIRESHDVKLARRVAKICRQPHQTIRVGEKFLREFPYWAERAVFLTDGTMDVSGAPDLYANHLARQIAPVRLTGNNGQEILYGAVAFKPNPLYERIFDREFVKHIREAEKTYRAEYADDRHTFITFKQVPWFYYSRHALTISQLTLRSPYLDNELVELSFRAPHDENVNIQMQLRLIAEGNPELGKLATDRAMLARSIPLLTTIKHLYQEFTFKAEYAYDSGMPQLLSKFDHMTKLLHLERLFLGRHKFYHFRTWYRDELSGYVKKILLDPRTLARPYLDKRHVEKAVLDHAQGKRNYTWEIHHLLTSELIHRQFID
jgi:asparagine synthase (glutamine-hydrolysing)